MLEEAEVVRSLGCRLSENQLTTHPNHRGLLTLAIGCLGIVYSMAVINN